MREILKNCNLCPRNCGVDRTTTIGACGANDKLKLAYYSLHQWEEPVISGDRGSGTIFFSNCNLKCIFCQNKKISTGGYGKEITDERFIEICLELQEKGAHNINLVTPTHYVPIIGEILHKIKGKELSVPIVYNTSSYENIHTLMMMRGIVDIYLADLKYYDDKLAKKYSKVDNYFEYATLAIDEMYRQVGPCSFDKDGMMKSGLIVRVLILPGEAEDAKKIIKYLYATFGNYIFISIMNQYTPIINSKRYPNLNRKVTDKEYDEVIKYALSIGVENAFIQEGDTQEESFIPKFDKRVL